MPNVEANIAKECVILPFNRKDLKEDKLQTTSLAALVAVTILHGKDECPEEKLMEIIERSGEAEILDAEDAYADLGLEELDVETSPQTLAATNDNNPYEVI